MATRTDARGIHRPRVGRVKLKIPEAGPLDQFFFVVAGIAAIGMSVYLLREGFRWTWSNWLFFILFWAMAAYLTLPRLHRILSDIYVPNYFFGRTRTSDGLLGDPINIAFRGEEQQLRQAMRKAGWTLADELTLKSAWRIVVATLGRDSYPEAPVSPLLLFGRLQDFAYQQEVDGSPGRRHHIRFWKCPDGWLLPGGHRVDWLAAATYDRAVGLSLFTFQVTHKIDANIDVERDYVTSSVSNAVPGTQITLLKDFTTGYHARNGGGDSIHTDGDLPVVELPDADDTPLEGRHRQERILRRLSLANALAETRESQRRPLSILGSAVLVLGSAATLVALGILELVRIGQFRLMFGVDLPWVQVGSIAAGVVLAAEIVLIVLTLRGSQRARLLLMAMLLVTIGVGALDHLGWLPWHLGTSVLAICLQIAGLMMLSSHSSREYAVAAQQLRREARAISRSASVL